MTDYHLQRFHQAQEHIYQNAFNEIKNGKKTSHWMWFIFPQIAGLGHSEFSKLYAIGDLKEAESFLKDPVLGNRLIAISKLLLDIKSKTAFEIFGHPDDLKLQSCMTLFSSLKDAPPVFQQVLDQYYGGQKDLRTQELMGC